MALRRWRRSREDDAAAARAAGAAEAEVPRVVVVTDSTASLPAGAAERWGIEVVPLEVALGDVRHLEGVDLVTGDVLAALTAGTRVTTSQPSPVAFARAYARAAARGAREVVSVHLSGELSGTVRAAEVAALAAPVPVHVVDSRTVAMGLGFAALAAAEVAGGAGVGGPTAGGALAGESADGALAAERARSVAASTTVLVMVDSLEHLRRGGRIGTAAAAVGGLLGMRPLLTVRDGRVEVAGSVRTRRAARERLLDVVTTEVTSQPGTRVAVHHLGQPDLGEELAEALRERLGDAAPAEVLVADVSAVIGAHAGPGLLGVVVAAP